MIPKSPFTAPVLAATAGVSTGVFLAVASCLFLAVATPARAATWGHAQWCAVTDNGGGDLMWECVYDSVEECQPFILAGNRGYCSLNPYWRGQNQPDGDD